MKSFKGLLLATAVPTAMLSVVSTVQANSPPHDEHMVLVDTIDLQAPKPLQGFDISFTNSKLDLYIFADRSNGSVDFFNASDATFLYRVDGFKGLVLNDNGTANNALSGPDGVLFVGTKEVWAGDGDSTLKVIDLASRKIVDSISTGGTKRVDEMAYDPADHIIAVANNADQPPFVTLVNTDTHKILGKILFDGNNGTPDATTTGIEQPGYSPTTGMFYVSVPQIVAGDANAAKGGVSVIDPISMKVTHTFEVDKCTPAGLAIGPNNDVLVGCGGVFDKATQSAIVNVKTGETHYVPEVGGSDQVWYDPGTHHYYLAAYHNLDSSGKANPVLGTIDALTRTFDGNVASSITSHSVAAERKSRHVFVPIGVAAPGVTPPLPDPTNPCPDTLKAKGCIAVYLPSSVDSDDRNKHEMERDDRFEQASH
jgi:DNA-binding beta-propeller fold protein YncE